MVVTIVLLAATFYISALLSSPNKSPTQIQKTKAAQITYTKKIDLTNNFGSANITPEVTPVVPVGTLTPIVKPTLFAFVPTLVISLVPTKVPTKVPTLTPVILAQEPTDIPEPTKPAPTPTLQPLLAYKSTSISPTPTLIPIKNTGGMSNPTPTKKLQPTGVQTLPETGWIQTSSVLFIVAMTTIFFSLLF